MKRKRKSWEPDHELLLRIVAALAAHYPHPLPDPDVQLVELANGNRENLLMHVMYLQGLGFMRSNLIELFDGGRNVSPYHQARLSWGAGPVLTRKGLNAHLGIEPLMW
ncbi:hypothetical protein KDX27_30295 [Burkholderia cenocepacia]|uniref:hypothetical protein n=1 Tax=Burkholderia cenocepacia TaxID=95486 RepID=UPI001B8E74E4|nr:hypothetical protein [Burkholderia cenocepacia]MBR8028896.1 hypothetical protein [Burkholderia cenocepacia]MBR8172024.1 hypothetical protein [Burkholderia cenocepacia]